MNASVPEIPLVQWRLKGFKSIVDETVDLRPLTLVVGPNSSGKTSLLQSIVLFVQAAQARSTGATFPLNGPLVSLIDYDHVACRFCQNPREETVIGGTLQLPREGRRYRRPLWAATARAERNDELSRSRLQGETVGQPDEARDVIMWSLGFRGKVESQPGLTLVRSATAHAQVSLDDGTPVALDFAGKQRRIAEAVLQRMVTSEQRGASGDVFAEYIAGAVSRTGAGPTKRTKVSGLSLQGGIPTRFMVTEGFNGFLIRRWLSRLGRLGGAWVTDPESRMSRQSGSRTADALDLLVEAHQQIKPDPTDEAAYNKFMSAADDVAAQLHPRHRRALSTPRESAKFMKAFVAAVGRGAPVVVPAFDETTRLFASEFLQAVEFLATNVSYLGPLREEPHQAYPWSPFAGATSSIGTKGEYLPAVLLGSSAKKVRAPSPSLVVEAGSRADMGRHVRLTTLMDSVQEWLQYLQVASALVPEDVGMGPGLRIVEPGSEQPLGLTDVGIGVSQVLPVVAACLMADPGSIVLLEQPELHLHPALQQRLGDFLLACALTGRQLIVETHSEHIVSRLRLRAAEAGGDEIARQCAVIYAEKTSEGTKYRPVEPDKYGGLSSDDWPEGFFDEGSVEMQRILGAAVEKMGREGEH